MTNRTNSEKRVIYMQLYREAQQLIDKTNPCEVKQVGEQMTCKRGRAFPLDHKSWIGASQFCCHGCKHLGPDGCMVVALTCKIWLCDHVKTTRPEVEKEMETIRRKILNTELHTQTYCNRRSIDEEFPLKETTDDDTRR